MANGTQMEQAIKEATASIARHGYKSDEVSQDDVMLAGFGYIADVFKRDQERVIKIKIDGKKFGAIGIALGSGAVSLFMALFS